MKTFSKSLKTFLTSMANSKAKDKRLVKLLLKIANGKSKYINPEFKVDYFSIRLNTGMIAYLPEGKEHHVNADGEWLRTGRQEMKPAKFVKDILHPRLLKCFKDHHFSNFASLFKTTMVGDEIFFKMTTFEDAYCWSGDESYPDENYHPDNDCLRSCMTGYPVHEFYIKFDCQVLVAVLPSGKYVGRAIIWNDVKTPRNEKIVCMDRIYVTRESYIQLFIDYAINNNMWHKERQSADCSVWVNENADVMKITDSLTVAPLSNKKWDYIGDAYVPYLDSFCHGTEDRKFLKTRKSFLGDYFLLRDTHGYPIQEDGGWVHTIDGEELDEEDAINLADDMYCHEDDKEKYLAKMNLTAAR